MIKLIKDAKVYSPEYLGKKDILITANKIAAIGNELSIDLGENIDFEIIDGNKKTVVPGFIDAHVHITGGGGEGGYKTRTPEIFLTDLTKGGITTVVGCLGTDGITRSMEALLAKANALNEEGITAYIMTGSYRLPLLTITGDVMKDIIVIDKVIGAGEIAITDHRSSQPTLDAIKELAGNVRVGGILSGKAGIINFHLGEGREMLNKIFDVVENTEIPITQFLPTHLNRTEELLKESIRYGKAGGFIDFTTSSNSSIDDAALRAGKALKKCLEEGVPDNRITFTSDGQGSLPIFNEKNQFVGLGIGKVTSLFDEVKHAIKKENIPIEIAIKTITSNPADVFKLKNKGRIVKGLDADLIILDDDTLEISTVIAMGKIMIRNKRIQVFGTFEQNL